MAMESEKTQYKNAFLSVGLFGGIQVAVMLISVLKNKLLAIWIGVDGFGIQNLLWSTITLYFVISNCGLQSSSVRDIAASSSNEDLLYRRVESIRNWNRWLGLLGMVAMLVMSPLLAKWVFDDITKWKWFAILSPCILFMNVYNGLYSILQGLRRVKLLAKANIMGAVGGFLFSMPLFFYFRTNGIVPALLVLTISTFFVSLYIYNKAKVPHVNNDQKSNYRLGLSSIQLGLALSINSIVVEVTAFLIKLFITRFGGVSDVGLFQAGWAINASYISVVFTAMAKDYLPRLSQVSDDKKATDSSIKQQGIMSVLILAPLLALMILFVDVVIKILYTDEFLAISQMTMLLLLGSLIKAASWSIAYVFIAKSDKKVFLFNEISTRLIALPFYLLGFYFYGLIGVGVAFLIEHSIYFLWIAISAYRNYGFSYDREFWTLFIISLLCLISLVALMSFTEISTYVLSVFVLLLFVLSSLEIQKRTGIITSLYKRIKK